MWAWSGSGMTLNLKNFGSSSAGPAVVAWGVVRWGKKIQGKYKKVGRQKISIPYILKEQKLRAFTRTT